MKLILIKPSGLQYDITNAVTKVEWSGSASSAARQLSFDYVNAPYDSFSLPAVSTGDAVSFTADSEELFYGQIFGSEKSTAIGTITFTAMDFMKNLLESTGQYNFKNLTPETIAQMVCDDAKVPVRYLYPTGVNIASMLCDEMSLYDIIMAAYTKAHRITGDKYFPMIYKRGFAVYRTEWIVTNFVLDETKNLLEASIEESMSTIVNRVKIYDDQGAQIGEVEDAQSLALYGLYQAIYKQEKDIDPTTAAKNLLKTTPTQSIKVSGTGDSNCLSCYFVTVSDKTTGLKGRYWISSDTHAWENGAYTMELELAFDSIMNTVESTQEEAQA